MIVTTDQKVLQAFIERRHPDYAEMEPHWEFLEHTYKGGREWFEDNIFQYLKEGEKEYKARIKRCYRFNHSREVVDLIQKYVFKSHIVRNDTDAPIEVKDFWKTATLSGLDIQQFMRIVGTMSSLYGRIWVFTDSTKTSDVISKAEENSAAARVYAYIVDPEDALDMGFDDLGELNWFLVRETVRDDLDPLMSSGEVYEQFRLWTRDEWVLWRPVMDDKKNVTIKLIGQGVHGLGRVPCFPVDHVIGDNRYSAPGLIDDIAYLDRAIANYLSNLDAIIQDQTFSQLAMPAQNILPGDDLYNQLMEMGTKRVFVYDGEGGTQPFYLSPDPKQAGVIIEVINKIIAEIYHTIGMSGERTKQDNAVGIDNSSGVAKAYDFERVNSLLASKAAALENAENALVTLVMLWHSKSAPAAELVKYPENFDVRGLYDEVTLANQLALIDAPASVRRYQMEQLVDKLFPRLSEELKKTLKSELEGWPVAPADVTSPPSPTIAKARNPLTQNRQGQVTGSTQ